MKVRFNSTHTAAKSPGIRGNNKKLVKGETPTKSYNVTHIIIERRRTVNHFIFAVPKWYFWTAQAFESHSDGLRYTSSAGIEKKWRLRGNWHPINLRQTSPIPPLPNVQQVCYTLYTQYTAPHCMQCSAASSTVSHALYAIVHPWPALCICILPTASTCTVQYLIVCLCIVCTQYRNFLMSGWLWMVVNLCMSSTVHSPLFRIPSQHTV